MMNCAWCGRPFTKEFRGVLLHPSHEYVCPSCAAEERQEDQPSKTGTLIVAIAVAAVLGVLLAIIVAFAVHN